MRSSSIVEVGLEPKTEAMRGEQENRRSGELILSKQELLIF